MTGCQAVEVPARRGRRRRPWAAATTLRGPRAQTSTTAIAPTTIDHQPQGPCQESWVAKVRAVLAIAVAIKRDQTTAALHSANASTGQT
jgi:hypothetical protein